MKLKFQAAETKVSNGGNQSFIYEKKLVSQYADRSDIQMKQFKQTKLLYRRY